MLDEEEEDSNKIGQIAEWDLRLWVQDRLLSCGA